MRTHEKPATIPAETVFLVWRTTHLGVVQAKQLLEQSAPLFYSRFIEAILEAKVRDGHLYDPIEDEPEFQAALEAAEKEAERIFNEEMRRSFDEERDLYDFLWSRGSYNYSEILKQRVLHEQYGIDWFTAREMNPGIHFD